MVDKIQHRSSALWREITPYKRSSVIYPQCRFGRLGGWIALVGISALTSPHSGQQVKARHSDSGSPSKIYLKLAQSSRPEQSLEDRGARVYVSASAWSARR